MALDKDAVRGIARLARIKAPEDQLEALAGELDRIIHWVDQLNELDTGDVEPMTSVAAMKLRRRADKVTDGGYPERVLANAPEGAHDFYAVPKVVE